MTDLLLKTLILQNVKRDIETAKEKLAKHNPYRFLWFKKAKIDKLKVKAIIEEIYNSYEIACVFYLNNRINKREFKEICLYEIKQLVESNHFTKHIELVRKENPTAYKEIQTVYSEWFK